MGSDYREVALSELIDVKHGFAFAGEGITDEANRDILLTPGNFALGGGFKGDKLKYFKGLTPEEYILSPADLVVTMTDLSKQADTLGFPALVPKIKGHRFLHNQRIGKVVIKNNAVIDKLYLYYLLRTQGYRNEVLAGATGTTVKHTAPVRILSYKTCIPPLSEQKRIAGILGALDDKIELNRKMNETLEQMAKALFSSWFIDFDPVHAKTTGRQPAGMDRETADLFPDSFVDSEMGKIPQGWKVLSLDEIAHFLNGLALQKYPPSDGPTLPVIKIAQLRKGDTTAADRCDASLPSEYVIEDGDVLFSWSGSLEVEIWCGGKGALNQHLFKVTSAEFPKWFYYLWTRWHLEEFRRIAAYKATTMGHIQRGHLTAAKVITAPNELLGKMTNNISPIIDRIVSNNRQSRTLCELRDNLLPKLLSGEHPAEIA